MLEKTCFQRDFECFKNISFIKKIKSQKLKVFKKIKNS